MPKTAINKECQFFISECKVGLAGKGKVPPPPGDIVFPEKHYHFELGGLVPLRLNGLHVFAPLFR